MSEVRSIAQLGEKVSAKRAEMKKYFEENMLDTKDENGNPQFKETFSAEEFEKKEAELRELSDEFEVKRRAAEVYKSNEKDIADESKGVNRLGHGKSQQDGDRGPVETRTLGQAFVDVCRERGIKGLAQGQEVHIDGLDMKTLFSTTAGYPPQTLRSGYVSESPQRRPVVADFIPQENTTENAYKYVREDTFTNNAAPKAEGDAAPESALAFIEVTGVIEDIVNLLPVTQRTLDDVPGMEGLVSNRMFLMHQLAEEDQLVNGNGSTPNLVGFLSAQNLQTQARGNDDTFTASLKAMTLVRTAGNSKYGWAEPSALIVNPTDWQNIILAKDGQGRFMFGDPSSPNTGRTLWGLPPVITNAIAAGTMLTGDFVTHSLLVRRQMITLAVGWINDDFAKGRVALKMVSRSCLVIYRGQAFCQVTGL